MITIALDCGASFLKGAVFEEDGTLCKTLHRPAPPVAQGKTVEELLMPTQAQALLSAVRAMLTELTAGQRCVRLCMANEMHGFLLTDSAGVPQMDYVSWQRSFGTMSLAGETAASFLTREHGDALRHTGMPLRGSLPSANLRYLSQCGMLDRMHGELFFCTLGDYLLRALSNAAVPTHPTNAAASGLYVRWYGRQAAIACCFRRWGNVPLHLISTAYAMRHVLRSAINRQHCWVPVSIMQTSSRSTSVQVRRSVF